MCRAVLLCDSINSCVGSQRCDIDEVGDISAEEFLLRYVLPRRPVVLRGAARNHTIRRDFAREEMLRRCVRACVRASVCRMRTGLRIRACVRGVDSVHASD